MNKQLIPTPGKKNIRNNLVKNNIRNNSYIIMLTFSCLKLFPSGLHTYHDVDDMVQDLTNISLLQVLIILIKLINVLFSKINDRCLEGTLWIVLLIFKTVLIWISIHIIKNRYYFDFLVERLL